MVAPVNPDKVFNRRIDTAGQSDRQLPSTQARQTTNEAGSQSESAADGRLEVDTARQLYQMENHQAGDARITTPEQARDLLGQILEQFSADPGLSLQAQSPRSFTALSNLLQRTPV